MSELEQYEGELATIKEALQETPGDEALEELRAELVDLIKALRQQNQPPTSETNETSKPSEDRAGTLENPKTKVPELARPIGSAPDSTKTQTKTALNGVAHSPGDSVVYGTRQAKIIEVFGPDSNKQAVIKYGDTRESESVPLAALRPMSPRHNEETSATPEAEEDGRELKKKQWQQFRAKKKPAKPALSAVSASIHKAPKRRLFPT